jgi:hypothetical protein
MRNKCQRTCSTGRAHQTWKPVDANHNARLRYQTAAFVLVKVLSFFAFSPEVPTLPRHRDRFQVFR